MDRRDFDENVREHYFKSGTHKIGTLVELVCSVVPVFGAPEVEISDNDDGGKAVKIIDKDTAEIVLAPKGTKIPEKDADMSGTVLVLHTNKDGIINFIEHGMNAFTRANKSQVLFCAGLIGHKVEF